MKGSNARNLIFLPLVILSCWALYSLFLRVTASQEPKGRSLSRVKGLVLLVFCLWQQVIRTDYKKDKQLMILCQRTTACGWRVSWARHQLHHARRAWDARQLLYQSKDGGKHRSPKLLANFSKTRRLHQCYTLLFLPFSHIYVLGAEFPPRDSNTDIPMCTLEYEEQCSLSKEQYVKIYRCFAVEMNSHKYACVLSEGKKWPESFTNTENCDWCWSL